MKKQVWILMAGEENEGGDVQSVFSSYEAAHAALLGRAELTFQNDWVPTDPKDLHSPICEEWSSMCDRLWIEVHTLWDKQ